MFSTFQHIMKTMFTFQRGQLTRDSNLSPVGRKKSSLLKKASKLTNFLQVLTQKGGDFLLSDTCTQKTYSLNLQKPEWNSNHSELTDDILV